MLTVKMISHDYLEHSKNDDLTDAEIQEMYDVATQEAEDESWRDMRNSDLILKRLKKSLRPKIWEAIQWELNSHYCLALGIVSIDEVKGRKETGNDYHGQSTAMRHVYVDVSSCSYSDTYGGNVYLYLGMGRYLAMFISG